MHLVSAEHDEEHSHWLPEEGSRLARWLYRHGWVFEESCWPAVRYLKSDTRDGGLRGYDLTLALDITQMTFGIEWPSDITASYGERWRDLIIHLGSLMVIWHRWWLRAS
jgi:hypothetical protein